jgi:hypothetical protein
MEIDEPTNAAELFEVCAKHLKVADGVAAAIDLAMRPIVIDIQTLLRRPKVTEMSQNEKAFAALSPDKQAAVLAAYAAQQAAEAAAAAAQVEADKKPSKNGK